MPNGKTESELREAIVAAIGRVLRESGRAVPEAIEDAFQFATDLKLDSLDMAVLVVSLESDLGVDPFRSGVAPVRTFGELVKVYATACNSNSSNA